MPRNPLLGIENEEEKKEGAAADQSDVEGTDGEEGADEESEDEGSEDASDEEEGEDEDEEEETKPVKKAVAPRIPAPSKKKKAAKAPGTGTLGDARIDTTVPLSANARTYWSALLESPLVSSIIPPDILNEDTEHVFCINSLRVIVPKGRIVQVPLMLAQEIAQSFKNRV